MLVLNVGLIKSTKLSSDTEQISPKTVEAALRAVGFFIKATRLVLASHAKGSEATLVVAVDANSLIAPLTVCVNRVAHALAQDCIAVKDAGGHGFLVGPFASYWGDFNPAYFHDLTADAVPTIQDIGWPV